jgi:hypothetical protein
MSLPSRPLRDDEAALFLLDAEPYLSCDDCFEQVDVRIEALVSGAPEPLTPAFRAHLVGCAACRDEAWSLAELAGQDAGVDADELRRRFDQALAAQGR